MIGFTSEKVQKEYQQAAVALRLVTEELDQAFGGACFVFRVDAPTKFERGVHSTGIALDVELRDATEEQMLAACKVVNQRFQFSCTPKVNLANFPSGKRMDRPHVHVQISWRWKIEPREFLKEFGYITEKEKNDV